MEYTGPVTHYCYIIMYEINIHYIKEVERERCTYILLYKYQPLTKQARAF